MTLKVPTFKHLQLLTTLICSVWTQSYPQQNCPCNAYDSIEPQCLRYQGKKTCATERKGIGGFNWDVANFQHWPYMVQLQIEFFEKGPDCYLHFCGGSLIGSNLVLSAAHCVDQFINGLQGAPFKNIFVSQAPHCRNLPSGLGVLQGYRAEVSYIEILPQWNRFTAVGDLAILVLNQTVPGPFVQLQRDYFNPKNATLLQVAGWGAINPQEIYIQRKSVQQYNMRQLYQDDIQYINNDICDFFLKRFDQIVNNSANSWKFLDYNVMFCAIPPHQKGDTCQGDSGSPIVLKGKFPSSKFPDPRQDVLVGIVSWGPLGECNNLERIQAPGVFVRISAFIGWIDEIIDKYFDPAITQHLQLLQLVP